MDLRLKPRNLYVVNLIRVTFGVWKNIRCAIIHQCNSLRVNSKTQFNSFGNGCFMFQNYFSHMTECEMSLLLLYQKSSAVIYSYISENLEWISQWKTTAGIYNKRSDWAYNFSCFCFKFFTKPFGGKRSVVFTTFQLLLWFMCGKTFGTWLTITHSVLAFRIYIFLYVAEFTLSENSVMLEWNGESFFCLIYFSQLKVTLDFYINFEAHC